MVIESSERITESGSADLGSVRVSSLVRARVCLGEGGAIMAKRVHIYGVAYGTDDNHDDDNGNNVESSGFGGLRARGVQRRGG